MAVIVNKNTTQNPITTGRTGTQSIKWIDSPRVYIKAKDSTPTPVTTKSNGTTPGGWTDLGIVDGPVAVAYTKEVNQIRTGVDNVLRLSYVRQKSGTFQATLSQFDDKVIEEVSGITPSVITAGSVVQFAIGQEDVIEKAMLLVSQNKIDGKEWQFYHPTANLVFNIENSGEFTVVRLNSELPSFTYNSLDTIMIASQFA
jgi:hypothetical protein